MVVTQEVFHEMLGELSQVLAVIGVVEVKAVVTPVISVVWIDLYCVATTTTLTAIGGVGYRDFHRQTRAIRVMTNRTSAMPKMPIPIAARTCLVDSDIYLSPRI
jgi:hypothetical protein